MMSENQLSQEELEQQNAIELPDREAMSVISTDPGGSLFTPPGGPGTEPLGQAIGPYPEDPQLSQPDADGQPIGPYTP